MSRPAAPAVLATVLLALLAVAFALRPGLAHRLAGYKPLTPPGPEAIDTPPPFDAGSALRFFEERNTVELKVARDMTAAELLRLYQIDFPHVRRQIAEQRAAARPEGLGSTILRDGDVLRRGEVYRLTLTPPAEGLP